MALPGGCREFDPGRMGRGQLKYRSRGRGGRGGNQSRRGRGGGRGAPRGGPRIRSHWTGSDEKRRQRVMRQNRKEPTVASSSLGTSESPSILENRILLNKNGPTLGLKTDIASRVIDANSAFAINFDKLACSISVLSLERRLGHVDGKILPEAANEEEHASGIVEGKDTPKSSAGTDATALAHVDEVEKSRCLSCKIKMKLTALNLRGWGES